MLNSKYKSIFISIVVLAIFTACSTDQSSSDRPSTSHTVELKNQYSEQQATYIVMPDDVRIAADIFLPKGVSDASNLPTIISFTRYWRSASFEPAIEKKNPVITAINAKGYAFIMVDTRGSGASFGTRGTEFSACEANDFKHVIDWVSKQSWSNGRVATIGISYGGNTAENAIFYPSIALKAAIPRFTDFDFYTSILFPGGLANQVIFNVWGDLVRGLDNNEFPKNSEEGTLAKPKLLGVKPVDTDKNRLLLNQAVTGHKNNAGVQESFKKAVYRDDVAIAKDFESSCDSTVSIYKFQKEQEVHQIPAYHWASWTDAGTAQGVLSRFASYKTPAHYIIGPWSHGAKLDTNPFNDKDHPLDMSIEMQYEKIFEFLDPLLMDNTEAAPITTKLDYFTMGENKWKSTLVWPPKNSTYFDWYLSGNKSLKQKVSGSNDEHDDYTVDYSAGTGNATRWTTQLGGTEVNYNNRAEKDEKLLHYTSAPLSEDTEITGAPIVELYMSSTHDDGAVIAYLEAINETGKVIMVTEGELRLIHRKISYSVPDFKTFGPYHSFKKADASLMVPGVVEKVTFTLLPTSVVIPKGYSLRLAIAGHDKDTFDRYPSSGTPTYSIYRNNVRPSKLILPIIAK
ncbi:MAG: CocE/NonD family hydrolase [Pseudomonadota bacterium]